MALNDVDPRIRTYGTGAKTDKPNPKFIDALPTAQLLAKWEDAVARGETESILGSVRTHECVELGTGNTGDLHD